MRFVREADDHAGHRDIGVTDGVAEPERGAAPGAVGLRATGRINRRSNKLPPGKVTALYAELTPPPNIGGKIGWRRIAPIDPRGALSQQPCCRVRLEVDSDALSEIRHPTVNNAVFPGPRFERGIT
jgi:hypothetical protein